MENDSKKIDFGEIESYQKSEGGNMKSDLEANKNNYDDKKDGEEGNIESESESESENKIVDSSPVLTPLSENSGQATARLLSPPKLLSDAWQLYKSRWKTFLGIIVAPILLVIPVFLVFGIIVFGAGMIGAFDLESAVGNIIIFAIGFVLLLALFLTIIIIQFWSQAALIYAIKDNAENIGIKESYRRGWHKLKSFFWVSILSGFIIMGGYMFFIIPGIIFAIWFSLALYIVIVEDLKGMDAILKSREYIRDYWWQVLWRFLIVSIAMFVISSVIFIPSMLIGFISLPIAGEEAVEIIFSLANNFVSIIIAPFTMIYLFLVYNNLKKIKGDFEFKPSKKSKRLLIVIGLLGFLIIPLFLFSSIVLVSLNSARHKAMDATRHSDIKQLQIKLLIYSDEERVYPKSLSELNGTGYFTDPETKEPYEYRQLDNGKDYEVCALFGEGRQCFYSEEEISSDSIIERDIQRISDLGIISAMLEYCKTKTGIYPLSHTTSKLNEDNHVVNAIRFANDNISIPVDSKDPEYYYGYKSLNGESFELTARLENVNGSNCDAEIKENGGICIYKLRY